MTTASAASATSGVVPGGSRAGVLGLSPVQMVGVITLVAGFVALTFRWYWKQLGLNGFSASAMEDWGHAYLVPLISGYAAWRERDRLRRLLGSVYWPGLVVALLGLVSYAYFVIFYPNHMFQGGSILLVLAGVVLLLAGPRAFGVAAFPIGYLALGMTISERVMNLVTFELKIMASQGSHVLLSMIGVENDVRGNLLTIFTSDGEELPLNVAEACSGMRMVIAFIALAVAVAFLGCRHWWQRIALVMLAVPVALLMNVIRVAVLGVLSLIDPDLATGDAHMFIGTVLLLPAFGLFLLVQWSLDRLFVDERGGPAAASDGGGA